MKLSVAIVAIVAALVVGALAVFGVRSVMAWGPFGGMMGGNGPSNMMGTGNGSPMMGSYNGQSMMGGWSGQSQPGQGTPIGLDQAKTKVQAYVDSYGNKDLAIDEVMEFENNYYAIVKEKSTGTGAFEVLVDKYSASVYPEHGPTMMWDTKYGMMSSGASGMMGGMMSGAAAGMMGGQFGPTGSSGPMTVTAEQARSAAQAWLDQNQAGSTTEEPDKFYGYYTIHTLKAGKVTGMISANGYTGQVWYHSWHGAFIQMEETK